MSDELTFRFAERKDSKLIFDFIMGIAKYEKMEDEVVNTPELIEKWLFDEHRAEVIFAVLDGREVGFELFFYNVLGSDAGMVGSRNPQGVVPLHPVVSHNHVLKGVVKTVPHVQNASNVRRRNNHSVLYIRGFL